MPRDIWIYSLLVSFLLGVFVHSLFLQASMPLGICAVIVFLFVVVALLFESEKMLLVSVILFGLLSGLFRFSLTQTEPPYLPSDAKVTLIGTIVSDPDISATQTQFIVKTKYLEESGTQEVFETKVLVKSSSYIQYRYGDELEIYGTLRIPEAFSSKEGRVFDYAAYLAKDQIYYTLSYAQIRILARQEDFRIQATLYDLKHALLREIYRVIPRPASDLLAGVLIGEQSRLGEDREADFRKVGLMHIVVLSGYNVSLVIYTFLFLFRRMPLWIQMLCASCAIFAFAVITGAGPTVLRASVMAFFLVLARTVHRPYDVSRSLFVAGVCMVIVHPRVLYFDLSFQLSFLASYGLLRYAPFFERMFSFLPKFLLIRESAVASFAAQIMVLPLILYHIGDFSVIAPLVNILVLFAVPPSMLLGFLASLGKLMPDFLQQSIAFLATLSLDYQLWVVELFAKLPFASISVHAFHWSYLLFAYLLLLIPFKRFQL